MRSESVKKSQRKYHRKIRNRTYKFVRRVKKQSGCSQCGYKEHYAALHFDHIDPTTKHHQAKGSAFHNLWSIKRLKAELRKCQILCANCHAIKTYNERH